MSLVFIKAPNFPCSRLICTPPSQSLIAHLHSIWAPCPPQHITHITQTHTHFAGPAPVFLSGPRARHRSVSCVHQQALHMSSPPTPPCALSFNLEFHYNRISWTFYVSFSCAADVLDWHKAKEKERERRRAGKALSESMRKKIQLLVHIHVFLLFSSCQLACLFISTLLHPQGDGWLGLPWLMPKGYGANGPAVLRGLWQAAVPPHWFWPNLNGMFLWWVLSGLVSVSYSPSWSKLSPMPKNKERHSLENHSEDHLALTSGESQEFLSHTVESEKSPQKNLVSFFVVVSITQIWSLLKFAKTHMHVYTHKRARSQPFYTLLKISFVYTPPTQKIPMYWNAQGKALWSPSVFVTL